jgi:hypothetical protein
MPGTYPKNPESSLAITETEPNWLEQVAGLEASICIQGDAPVLPWVNAALDGAL